MIEKKTKRILKALLKRTFLPPDYREKQWENDFPYLNKPEAISKNFNSPIRVGIISDKSYSYKYYISACINHEISYTVIDLLSDDWLDQIKSANVSVLFSWPYSTDRVMRDLYQSRAYLINKFLSIQLVPSFDESWFYENKAKLADFLKVKGYSHPQTHVFYRKEDATEFANISKYPVVFKTDIGALSSGVIICKSVNEAQKLINKCFGKKGYTNASIDYRDKQWGYIIFQECITDAKEWRMVQIGDSVMCRIKEKIGEYHSGSGKVEWGKPSKRLLDLFWSITEKENFKSVNIDFFEDSVGNYLINEIHPVFGDILKNNLVKSSGLMGRYLKTGEDWIFEPGYFYENACADLRLEYYIENIII